MNAGLISLPKLPPLPLPPKNKNPLDREIGNEICKVARKKARKRRGRGTKIGRGYNKNITAGLKLENTARGFALERVRGEIRDRGGGFFKLQINSSFPRGCRE